MAEPLVAKAWTFTQLSNKRPARTLQGWNAPFGRPRQGAIINAGVSIRRSITYYADTDNGPTPPTIHAFGTEPKPFELHGRWMDRTNAVQNFVRQAQRDWVDFVSDKDLVSARWGDILSYIIFIHDIDLHFESETEIVWSLKADVVRDDQAPVAIKPFPLKAPKDFASDLSKYEATILTPVPPTVRALLGDLTDRIDAVVATIKAPFGEVYDTAIALGDFGTALTSDLVKLATSLQVMKTGLVTLRDMTEFAIARLTFIGQEAIPQFRAADAVGPLGMFSGPDQIDFASTKIQRDLEMANLLALIADMLGAIQNAQRGKAVVAHSAQIGDTWESIATQKFGGPGGARAIKDMNGIRYGQRPQPGKVYQVPRKA